jgi:hypothetical protein
LLSTAAALSLAGFAYGAPPDPNAPAATSAPAPAAPQSAPAPADPQSTAPESAPPQSSGSADASAQLESLVPQGMNPQQACSGFNSVSDCAITLHVAQNLQIPFPDLKDKLASGQSIIAAISEMKPGADAQAEVQKAVTQARSDVGGAQ